MLSVITLSVMAPTILPVRSKCCLEIKFLQKTCISFGCPFQMY
jgi:hypothetical protein